MRTYNGSGNAKALYQVAKLLETRPLHELNIRMAHDFIVQLEDVEQHADHEVR